MSATRHPDRIAPIMRDVHADSGTGLADYFLHAKASDADALAVMAPRDGRS